MTTHTSLIETVQSLYAAFGRGDIPSILARLDADVQWSINVDPAAPGVQAVPVFRLFRGPAEVANFFALLARDAQFHAFAPETFLTSGSEVAVRVVMEFTVKPTQRRLRLESMHLFTFGSHGRVTLFREFSDTLAVTAAWGGV